MKKTGNLTLRNIPMEIKEEKDRVVVTFFVKKEGKGDVDVKIIK